MVQLIVGKKGKGKTKYLLDKVNTEVKEVIGNVVYLDKSAQHMFELNNKVRLIDVSSYPIHNSDEFLGFIYGIISQDSDLEKVYIDSFLKIASLDEKDLPSALEKLEKAGEAFQIDFIVSASVEADDLSEYWKSKVIVSL